MVDAAKLGAGWLLGRGHSCVAFYRRHKRDLRLVFGLRHGRPWDAAPPTLPGVSDSLTELLDGAGPDCRVVELEQWGALSGYLAVRMWARGEVVGLAVVEAAELGPGLDEVLTVAALVGAQIRIQQDEKALAWLRTQRYEQLVRSETLAATGLLSAGVAHELNNPLGVVLGLAQLLAIDDDLPAHVLADLRVIEHESRRAVKVVEQLLSYGRGGGMEPELVDLGSLVENSVGILQNSCHSVVMDVVTSGTEDSLQALVDPFRLQKALLGIMENARQAIARAGRTEGRLEIAVDPVASDRVAIAFVDDGPGIAPDVLPRVFDPFFTTHVVGDNKGTGMGLALVQRTMEEMGGLVMCENIAGGGARFVLMIPRG